MLYISSFTFGGGFVIISFMKSRFVDKYALLSEQEMLDITALAQSAPGAVAVNAAILVGWKLAGFAGMLSAVLGTVIPPIAILCTVSLFYNAFSSNRYIALILRGMSAGVAAVIADVVCKLGWGVLKERPLYASLIIAAVFCAVFFFKINVILVILCAAAAGALTVFIKSRKKEGGGEKT